MCVCTVFCFRCTCKINKNSRAGRVKNPAKMREKSMLRKIIEKLFWHYQEKENWRMKMNEPIAIKKLTKEEADRILRERRKKDDG